MQWTLNRNITKRINFLVKELGLMHISPGQIFSFRSRGSSSQATARIWSLPTIWQQALEIKPHYCLEVISERFDKLSLDDQERVLIHELLHIPKTFGGGFRQHDYVCERNVELLYRKFLSMKQSLPSLSNQRNLFFWK